MATSTNTGQFSGDVPLSGHNIQKHSINAALREGIPDDVVRSCVTHFGTRGLFGTATRRTVEHEQENMRKKKKRVTEPSKRKSAPRRKHAPGGEPGGGHAEISLGNAEGPPPATNPAESEYTAREMILVFSPPPLPSPLPNFPASSSPPAPFVLGEYQHAIPSEDPLFCDKVEDSRPVVLPDSGSADGSNHSSSVPSLSSQPGVVYPWRAPLTGAFSYHDLAVGSSSYGTHANQGHTSLGTRPAASMSTSGTHIANAGASITELAEGDGTTDTSTSALALGEHQMYLVTGVEQALNAPICTGPIVDPNTDTAKNLHTHDQPLYHMLPYLSSGAPQCAPDSQFAPLPSDLACPESLSHRSQVPPPFNHFAGPMALPPLESDSTLPISANINSHIPSPPNRFDESSVAHPRCTSPSDAVVYHDPAVASSQCDAPAYRGYTSLDAKYATLVLTAAKIRDDARHATQVVGSRAIADVSARAPAFAEEVNSPIHLAPGDQQGLNAPIDNEGPVHIDTRITESLIPTYDLPQSQGTLYPTWNAPRDAPRSGYYPLATFVEPESPSDRVPSSFSHFTMPDISQVTTDPYAGEVHTPIAPYITTPVPARTHCNASYIQDCALLDNGYTAWSLAGHSHERPVSPPSIAYLPSPASSSDAAAVPLSYNTPARGSTTPSSSLVNALGDYSPQPPCIPYRAVDDRAPSAGPVGNRALVNASTSALEVIWQMIPEHGSAPVAGQTVNAFTGSRSSVDANASCACAECIASTSYYAQGFKGCLDACNPPWLPPAPCTDDVAVDSVRGQWGDGGCSNVPPPCVLGPPILSPSSLAYAGTSL